MQEECICWWHDEQRISWDLAFGFGSTSWQIEQMAIAGCCWFFCIEGAVDADLGDKFDTLLDNAEEFYKIWVDINLFLEFIHKILVMLIPKYHCCRNRFPFWLVIILNVFSPKLVAFLLTNAPNFWHFCFYYIGCSLVSFPKRHQLSAPITPATRPPSAETIWFTTWLINSSNKSLTPL
jgi:hypothetical protein